MQSGIVEVNNSSGKVDGGDRFLKIILVVLIVCIVGLIGGIVGLQMFSGDVVDKNAEIDTGEVFDDARVEPPEDRVEIPEPQSSEVEFVPPGVDGDGEKVPSINTDGGEDI